MFIVRLFFLFLFLDLNGIAFGYVSADYVGSFLERFADLLSCECSVTVVVNCCAKMGIEI